MRRDVARKYLDSSEDLGLQDLLKHYLKITDVLEHMSTSVTAFRDHVKDKPELASGLAVQEKAGREFAAQHGCDELVATAIMMSMKACPLGLMVHGHLAVCLACSQSISAINVVQISEVKS